MSAETEIRAASEALVEAFGRGDLDAYFGSFADDATFLFHTTDRRLTSTEDYRREWAQWVAEDGFAVLDCLSEDRLVQVFGDAAVFTHRVRTTVSTNEGESVLRERETIVFAKRDGRWVAVHEHLSPDPAV
jgi:uncharacterized protein (TIGR02246 family)